MTETVFLVDDDTAVLRSLAAVLEGEGFTIKAFESGKTLLENCDEKTAGCIVLDMRMPGMDGLEVQAELNKRGVHMPVIFLTGHGDVPMSVHVMKNGAYDFLQKPVAADTLIARVYGALRLDKDRQQKQDQKESARRRLRLLSQREEEVLSHLLQGKTNKLVAKDLGLSPRTVEIHRKNILAKTQASNLIELSQLFRIVEEG